MIDAAAKDLVVAVAAAAKKGTKAKFRPRPITKLYRKVPLVDGSVPKGAPILIIKQPWIDHILSGKKKFEIRGTKCSKVGDRIYLAMAGAGGIVVGSAHFDACHGPLRHPEWLEMADGHCVAGKALPYGGRTFAWELSAVERFRIPVKYVHKKGTIVWAKM